MAAIASCSATAAPKSGPLAPAIGWPGGDRLTENGRKPTGDAGCFHGPDWTPARRVPAASSTAIFYDQGTNMDVGSIPVCVLRSPPE